MHAKTPVNTHFKKELEFFKDELKYNLSENSPLDVCYLYPAVVDRCFPIACGMRKEKKKRGRVVIDLKYNEIQIESRHMTIKVKVFKLNVILQNYDVHYYSLNLKRVLTRKFCSHILFVQTETVLYLIELKYIGYLIKCAGNT